MTWADVVNLVWLSILLSSGAHCVAQNIAIRPTPKVTRSYAQFIPTGYKVLKEVTGDLNDDGYADVVVVLSQASLFGKRCLLVMFHTPKGHKVGAINYNVVMCARCGNAQRDPFVDIRIEKGDLIIEQSSGGGSSWASIRTFRYKKGDLYFVHNNYATWYNNKYCDSLENNADAEYVDIDLVTGERYRKRISLDCQVLLDKVDKISTKPLVKLSDFRGEYISSEE